MLKPFEINTASMPPEMWSLIYRAAAKVTRYLKFHYYTESHTAAHLIASRAMNARGTLEDTTRQCLNHLN